jgi:hypothetical protein
MLQKRTMRSESGEPLALHDHAMDNLRFIRQTMERAGSFTAISGWGMALVGATALVAGVVASLQPLPERWVAVWIIEAVVAVVIAVGTTLRKARRAGEPLLAGPGRKFVLSFAPTALAAALLTPVLFAAGLAELLPSLWLLLYGAGVITGGTFSVQPVPLMGVGFMLAGSIALFSPPWVAEMLMTGGFSVLHVVFGVWIGRKYGG